MDINKQRRGGNKRQGAAAVEMAMVAPLLVLLFLGMTEFGSILYTRHTIVLAAREGARQMAIEGATEQEATDVVNDFLNDAGYNNTATITTQNAYRGSGDDASARRVNVQVSIAIGDASLLGDILSVFGPDTQITANVSMRKEGELTTAPTN